jgi:preprotein translocase subunit SecG
MLSSALPIRHLLEDARRVDWILAVGQVAVSIALIASILLQARGAGLGAAFGGDSSVYRSRRGIEKRLFQFTVVLAVLFIAFSLANYILRGGGTTG